MGGDRFVVKCGQIALNAPQGKDAFSIEAETLTSYNQTFDPPAHMLEVSVAHIRILPEKLIMCTILGAIQFKWRGRQWR
jgi:hypothetical protein